MSNLSWFARVLFHIFVCGLVPATSMVTFTFAQPQLPFKIEDALGVLSIAGQSPINLSPDGEWVTYTVQDARKRETPNDPRYSLYTKTGAFVEAVGCDIWITNTKTTETQNLTHGDGTSWSPVWSPDGKYLAFYSDRGGLARLWLWERTTSKMRQASDAIVRPFFNSEVVRWSSDSREILFKTLPEHMTLERAADLTFGPSAPSKPDKSSRNSEVTAKVYSFIPRHDEQQSPSTDSGSSPVDAFNRYLSDLAVLDVPSGHLIRIARSKKPLGYWFSPDSQYVAYTHFKSVEENTQQIIYELSVVSISDGRSRVMVPNLRQEDGGSVSWSPDSKQLAYITSGPRTKSDCFVIALEGGEPRNLTEGKYPPFGDPFGDESRPPLWDSEGKNLYLVSAPHYGQIGSNKIWRIAVSQGHVSEITSIPDHVILNIVAPVTEGRLWNQDKGNSIVVMAEDNTSKQIGFYHIDLRTGTATKLFERGMSVREPILTTDVSQNKVAYVAQDVGHAEDIWILDQDLHTPKKISKINPQLEGVSMGSSRIISWRSLNGEELHGALLLPADYKDGDRCALIVNVYGGAYSSGEVNRFGFGQGGAENMQILATRGFAVLLPDAPLAKGTPMQDLLATVMPGVNRVVELGIADPGRLGLMGHSYGGYSTLGLIVQTKTFKAAVDSAGVSDLISEYTSMIKSGESPGIGWVESGQGGMPGTPWQFRSAYIENSPLFYLDRVETPLLIVHGELDDVVPVTQAEAVFVGLRRLGKEVVYVKYGGEGHWEGEWGPNNVIDYWKRVISWFDEHLKEKS